MNTTHVCRAFLVASLSIPAVPALANGVRIADQPALGTFTSLQAAIQAAPEGSVLLIQSGSYGSAVIDAKSLTLIEINSANATIQGQITVKNLSAAQRVVISGLSASASYGPALLVQNCAGNVRISDGTFNGGIEPSGLSQFDDAGAPGARVQSSEKIVFSSCVLNGHDSPSGSGNFGTEGGHGIDSVDGGLALYDCAATGGEGAYEGAPSGGPGGDAIHAVGWGLSLSGCTLGGGDGGGGDYIGCNAGGDGGDAIDITNGQVHILDVASTPGSGGLGFCAPHGAIGQAVRAVGSTVDNLAGNRRKLAGPRLFADRSTFFVTITGQPGDAVFLLSALSPGFTFKKNLHATWCIPSPYFISAAPQGVVPPSGVLALQVRSSDVASGAFARTSFLQVLCLDALGQSYLTGPLHVTLLDREASPDCNGNGDWDVLDVALGSVSDCNQNFDHDVCEIAAGTTPDCNTNGMPDSCDIASGTADCNHNGVPDTCDLNSGSALDCNVNGRPDSCDIANGTSLDVNGNGVPDECEEPTPTTLWVDASAAPGGNGSSAAPFTAIRDGINASFHGDTVMVRDGVYTGGPNRNLDPKARRITIRSEHGAAACIIDCQFLGRGFRITSGEGRTCIIDGFTIRNGDVTHPGTLQNNGGAIVVMNSSPTIRNCVIDGCKAAFGAGIYGSNSSMEIRGCTIRNCDGTQYVNYSRGGGVYWSASVYTGTGILADCTVENCRADGGAGVLLGSSAGYPNTGCVFLMSSCRIIGNTATTRGGGVTAGQSGYPQLLLRMSDCLIAGNDAPKGGGLYLQGGSSGWSPYTYEVAACTFVDNHSTTWGGAIEMESVNNGMGPLDLQDSILWNNTAPIGPAIHHAGAIATLRVRACDVQGGLGGISVGGTCSVQWASSNIALDPAFADADGLDNNAATLGDNDYRLASSSPCIDAGDNSFLPADFTDIDGDGDMLELLPLDLDHFPRRRDDPLVPDTGIGTAPVVDMGSYERQP